MSRAHPQEPADFTTRQESGATVIEFATDNLLGLADLNRLGPRLLALANQAEGQKLVLDLSRVRYAGSAALGLLLKLDVATKECAGKLTCVKGNACPP